MLENLSQHVKTITVCYRMLLNALSAGAQPPDPAGGTYLLARPLAVEGKGQERRGEEGIKKLTVWPPMLSKIK